MAAVFTSSMPEHLTPGVSCLVSSSNKLLRTGIDEACLWVRNVDPSKTIELWGQSSECYKCSFWHYATLAPNTNASLVVNTTYPTMLSTQINKAHHQGMTAYFKESGTYLLTMNSTDSMLTMEHRPDNTYLPLLYALIFYTMLFVMWQFGRFLRVKMEPVTDPEETPILPHGSSSSHGGYGGTTGEDQAVASTSAASNTFPSSYLDSSSRGYNSAALLQGQQDTEGAAPDVAAVVSKRLRSLDVFRGLTIFLMIFVNYGGGKYYFFQHSPWNGLTVADLLFPWFMWIMGVSLVFSLKSQLRKNVPRLSIVWKILKRSVVLFGLGLLVNGISNSNVTTLRIPGVLQRFAFCYLFTAAVEAMLMLAYEDNSIESWAGWRPFRDIVSAWLQWSIVIGLVSVQVLVTYVLPVPGCPRGYIGPGGLHDYGTHENCTGGAAAYIDRMIFSSAHMYQGSTARHIYQNTLSQDPEGTLGFLTSLLMVQFGVAAGRVLITFECHKQRLVRMLVWAATSGLVAGVLCNFSKEGGVVPVNKNLWSLSYVLATACFAFLLFAFMYAVVDWAAVWNGNPARYLGLNSILLYVGHELLEKVFPFSWTPVGPTHGEHLLMNLWGASLWGLIAYVCHKKKVYFSV